ncbi:hypothetical protein NDU88_001815 [Pleurodeles waltl]|uniref:Uncharacterized protein n=1 Tax=Pleurodeles waltl TaxID=8319 RepID=A0AAV7UAI7_PLEWA|nr:hypothetical protein NDU88_001815 [Pleurodeles waltl]
MHRTPFRFCHRCHAKYPYTDQHLVCNLCLSPDHWVEDCKACRLFRSKKTLRLQGPKTKMASNSSEHLNVIEEEQAQTVSIRDTDSEQESEDDRPITAGQHVSTSVSTPLYKKQPKAFGTPLPEGQWFRLKKYCR